MTLLAFPLGLYLWVFVQVSLHETAHVVASRLVGLSPFAVVIGKGPLLFRGRMWGLDVRLHFLPFFGVVLMAPPPADTRWRGVTYVAAGALPDRIAAVVLFFSMLAIYQSIVILLNLIPLEVKVGAVTTPNDGKQVVGYLTQRRSVALDAYRDSVARYDPTFRIEDSFQTRGDVALLSLLFHAEEDIAAKRYANGVEKYLRILNQPGLHRAEKAKCLDRLACIPIFEGERNLLAAADEWSKEAIELVPDCTTVRGTRGAILVERGCHAEGLVLLMPLTSEGNTKIDRELSACYVAKALHASGRASEAREWIRTARSYGQFPAVCKRVESDLAAA